MNCGLWGHFELLTYDLDIMKFTLKILPSPLHSLETINVHGNCFISSGYTILTWNLWSAWLCWPLTFDLGTMTFTVTDLSGPLFKNYIYNNYFIFSVSFWRFDLCPCNYYLWFRSLVCNFLFGPAKRYSVSTLYFFKYCSLNVGPLIVGSWPIKKGSCTKVKSHRFTNPSHCASTPFGEHICTELQTESF